MFAFLLLPFLLPGCHEVSSFPPLFPSIMLFLLWISQSRTVSLQTMNQVKSLILYIWVLGILTQRQKRWLILWGLNPGLPYLAISPVLFMFYFEVVLLNFQACLKFKSSCFSLVSLWDCSYVQQQWFDFLWSSAFFQRFEADDQQKTRY